MLWYKLWIRYLLISVYIVLPRTNNEPGGQVADEGIQRSVSIGIHRGLYQAGGRSVCSWFAICANRTISTRAECQSLRVSCTWLCHLATVICVSPNLVCCTETTRSKYRVLIVSSISKSHRVSRSAWPSCLFFCYVPLFHCVVQGRLPSLFSLQYYITIAAACHVGL